MNMKKTIAENIKRARTINKMSISELSARTRIPERKIKSYESGDEFQSIQDIIKISKEMNLSVDFFFDHIGSEVRLRGSKMPEREKKAVIELARYKARAPADLAIILGIKPFRGISKQEGLNPESAKKLGDKMAVEWSTGDSLSATLEKHGVFVIKIPSKTALFRGIFVLREGIPVIAIPEREREPQETIEDISHELGHAVFLNQELDESKEEQCCDEFSEGFSKKFIERNGKNLGTFDFVERAALEAWKKEKATASFAAEAIGISTASFLERFSK